METDPGGAPIQPPYGYTADDLDRGYTVAHGRGGATERRPIPADILLVVELRRLRALLERAMAEDEEGEDGE
jgi:hypothetical protein